MGQLEFESKIRSKDNLREFFAIHHNLFFPKETCFNTNFIKQVFKGEKLLLGLNESYPPDLAYIKDANLFDKAALFKVIKDKLELCKYLPDVENESRIGRDFLICVIFYKDKNLFNQLYSHYLDLRRKNGTSSLVDKVMDIDERYKDSLLKFIPSKLEKKSKMFQKNLESSDNDVENINIARNNNNVNINLREEVPGNIENSSLQNDENYIDNLISTYRYGPNKKKTKMKTINRLNELSESEFQRNK